MNVFANKPGTKIAVWIVSALLAAFFVFVGSSKALMAWEVLEAASMGIPVILLKIAGFAELFGAVGLIVPALTRIAPVLTPIAAAGLAVTMIGATGVEIALGRPVTAVEAAVAGVLAAFVAIVRFAGLRATTPRRVPEIGTRHGVSAGAA
ncbi:DoxX family protein [Microlunatus parietis]|uniref:DoxX-like family protein n=1 Tax=Microlunatus parietis TaxID=682979 RepID=A0A7Y9IA31_9ACTN|nr:DoxX family protein [Microlunatus parietis]NYE73121.1 hypothetical protein [Microlunatus parietis]